MAQDRDPRRAVPRTDAVLADPALAGAVEHLGRSLVKDAVTAAQQRVRSGELDPEQVVEAVLARLPAPSSLRPVINATGVLLHTNLGRAPLSGAAVAAVVDAAGPTDVELDLATGRRARRGRDAMSALAAAVPSAQAVHAVNNGAAALVLAVTALAAGREVVISRGEMVEIGDGFRLHELIASTGARVREVGTTNRTHLRDYADALGGSAGGPGIAGGPGAAVGIGGVGVVLKVHPSNFVVRGFTSAPSTHDLAALCRERGVPLVVDTGSGLLAPHPLLPDEPDAATALRAGADLVTASGDKLLGGPQAGLLLGRADLVEAARRHPLARALRVDKLTLAALEATLRGPEPPVLAALATPVEALAERARRIVDALTGALTGAFTDDAPTVGSAGGPVRALTDRRAHEPADGLSDGAPDVRVTSTVAAVGGGGAPEQSLPSVGLSLPEAFARTLRAGAPPVLARVEGGRTVVDLRSVPPAHDAALARALAACARSLAVPAAAPA